jgi:hypothetical protein
MRRPHPETDAAPRGSTVTAGGLAASTWLANRSIAVPAGARWHVEIALGVTATPPPLHVDRESSGTTMFHLDIYAEEWGFHVSTPGKSSWIRVTDIAFVHGRDEFQLLAVCPPLKDIGLLVRRFEQMHRVRFQRQLATITTNLDHAEPPIRSWLTSL